MNDVPGVELLKIEKNDSGSIVLNLGILPSLLIARKSEVKLVTDAGDRVTVTVQKVGM